VERGRLREKYELSNVAIGKYCSVSEKTIRNWLSGHNLPSDNQLINVRDAIEKISEAKDTLGKKVEQKVRAHIAQEIPLSQNFKVLVNGHVCEPRHVPASRRVNVNYTDPVCGQIVGQITVARKMLSKPGILTTVRGRVVGEPSLFNLSPTSFTYHVGDLITGSVEVADFDPEKGIDAVPVIKTDREGFIETHPKFLAYSNYITKLLTDICREEEKKRQAKKDAEKKAKVDDAIKQVAQDLNAYDELIKRITKQESIIKGKGDNNGTLTMRPDLQIETKIRLRRHREHMPIPPEAMKEVKATLGSGHLRFGNQFYEIKQLPRGLDFPECDIRPRESLILVNLDHPAYEQGIDENCVEITVFRAISARFAADMSESPEEMYEQLDRMIRFHAERTKGRKEIRKKQLNEGVNLALL